MSKTYESLEIIMGDLAIGESVEGVVHPETIYEKVKNKEEEIITLIEAEVFELLYSKKYRSLKFTFSKMDGDIEIDSHTIKSLKLVYFSLKEIENILNKIQDEIKTA